MASSAATASAFALPRPAGVRLRRAGGVAGKVIGAFVPVFLLGSFLTFLLGALSGRSPAAIQLGEGATPEAIRQVEAEWGMDRPLLVRYGDWLWHLLQGDLGTSWSNGTPVSGLLAGRAVISISAAGLALLIGVVVGFALGALSARYQGSLLDRGITVFTSVISVMPPFIVGIALISIVAVQFGLLPAAGYVPLGDGFGPWLSHLILPALALSLDTVSDVARQLRVGLVTAQRENYVLGAVVRGLSRRRIFYTHVLRNSVGPAIAVLGLKFPAILGGAVVTESIFQLSGYGVFASSSAIKGDVPAVQAILVIAVVVVVLFNLLVSLILSRLIPASARGI